MLPSGEPIQDTSGPNNLSNFNNFKVIKPIPNLLDVVEQDLQRYKTFFLWGSPPDVNPEIQKPIFEIYVKFHAFE